MTSSAKKMGPSSILDAWFALRVPKIEVAHLDPKQPVRASWVRRDTLEWYWDLSNPQGVTAYHLAVILPTQPAPVLAAYCLLAFARENEKLMQQGLLWKFVGDGLAPTFEAHQTDAYWWHGAARIVLPPLSNASGLKDRYVRAPSWTEIVEAAAQYWMRAAEQSMPVWHPDWEHNVKRWRKE